MYYVYLGGVLLPIAPEEITLKIKNQNKTVTLINEGEINFLRAAGLTEINFNALIPAVPYSFAKYDGGFKSPSYFLDQFEKMKTGKKPVRFIVSRAFPNGRILYDTTMSVSVEDYEVREGVKEGFDLVIRFKLKQYRYFGTNVVQVSGNTATIVNQRDQSSSPAPKQDETYTVKDGDCLWNIAKAIYGDGSKYTVIKEANKDKISSSNIIYTGTVLKIPAL